ncbi:hypothetical protein Tco_0436812 [Tanacetum coccineum]
MKELWPFYGRRSNLERLLGNVFCSRSRLIVGVFYLIDFLFDLLLMIIMVNLPPPNNDPNVPKDEHVPAPKHAPIAPNPAPIQPNDYLADDEEDPKEEPEEEEEPIPEQAPVAPAGFAPQ